MKTFNQFLENADLKQRQQNFRDKQNTMSGDSGGGILNRDQESNSVKDRRAKEERRQKADEIRAILASEDISPEDNPLNQPNKNAEERQRKQRIKSQKNARKNTTTNLEKYEAYDPDLSGAQIRRTGEGGRKQPKRDTTDRRKPGQSPRMRAVGGGKMEPVGSYKDRKDIGTTKARSEREQQPQKERGSTEVKQSYADKVKAERRAAAQARIAARKSGQKVKSTTTSSKDAEKKASEMLRAKKAEPKKTEPAKPRRSWKTAEGGGMTRQERDSARNKERGQSQAEIKKRLRSEFEKNNGRKPNKKEAIQLTAKAIAASKALS